MNNVAFVLVGDHGFPIKQEDFSLPSFYGFQKAEMVAGVFSQNRQLFTGTRVEKERVVSQLDVGPTILDLVGVKSPHHFQGTSWLTEAHARTRLAVFMKNDVFSVHGSDGVAYGHYDSTDPVFVASDSQTTMPQGDTYISAARDVTGLADMITFWLGLIVFGRKRFLTILKGSLQSIVTDLFSRARKRRDSLASGAAKESIDPLHTRRGDADHSTSI